MLFGAKNGASVRRLAVDDIDWSQYCVVRINEYKDMRAEIERLRTELNNQAFITETLRNHQPH